MNWGTQPFPWPFSRGILLFSLFCWCLQMVLIILFKCEPENCHLYQTRLRALSFPLKTNKAKTLLAFSVLQKKKGDKFYDTDSKPIQPWIGMPLNSPPQSKYKTQHHHCVVQAFIPIFYSDLPKGCREGNDKYFSTGLSSELWQQIYLPNESSEIMNKSKSLFASGSAQEGLYIDITTANGFDFSN